MALNPTAERGYSTEAATYGAGRPGYPPEVVEWLRSALGLGSGVRVLDLGAGTGKFLPSLLATGADVVAVEPVAAMREELTEAFPHVAALEGSAQSIPLPDASVDAVVCAQAFHWFVDATALAEIRRVLKPGGTLGLIWNLRDHRVGWVQAVSDIVDAYEGDTPRVYSGAWRAAFPAEGFGPLTEEGFDFAHEGAPEAVVVSRNLSSSFIAALPAAEKAAVADRLRALVAATPDLAGRDRIAFPYRTEVYSARKIG